MSLYLEALDKVETATIGICMYQAALHLVPGTDHQWINNRTVLEPSWTSTRDKVRDSESRGQLGPMLLVRDS